MKKKYYYILGFLLLSISSCIYGLYKVNISKSNIITTNKRTVSNSNLLVMVQDEENKYIPWESEEWPPIDKYKFNENLSKCENGSTITWKEETNSVILKANTSDRCSAYFDIDERTAIEKNISRLVNLSKDMSSLEKDTTYLENRAYSGELVHHDGSIKGEDGTVLDAADGGYRYSGDNPNNFVCFGPGAEGYSQGTSKTCDANNLYRIIGIVPVETENNENQNLVKLIQSEYATKEQLGSNTPCANYSHNNSYENQARVQKTKPEYGFYWNNKEFTSWNVETSDGKYNLWENNENNDNKQATLNKALNDANTGYLHYLDNSTNQQGINWTSKIETVKWNIAGGSNDELFSVTAKTAYTNETNTSKDTGGSYKATQTTSTAKIGLMYVHDYGFASDKNNWNTNLSVYNTSNNTSNNWLFNGVYEWAISRGSDDSSTAFRVGYSGLVNSSIVNYNPFGVRPVFYLKYDVQFSGGDGTALTPYALKVN